MKLKKPANPVWTLLQRRYLILKTIPLTVLSKKNFAAPEDTLGLCKEE